MTEPSYTGASISILIFCVLVVIAGREFREHQRWKYESEIVIVHGEEDQFVSGHSMRDCMQFEMQIDITFDQTPCSILSFDVVDATGMHLTNVQGTLVKSIISKEGQVKQQFNAVSAAQGKKINQDIVYTQTLDNLKQAQGCNIAGTI
jgi:hypothetical protein